MPVQLHYMDSLDCTNYCENELVVFFISFYFCHFVYTPQETRIGLGLQLALTLSVPLSKPQFTTIWQRGLAATADADGRQF